MEEVIKTICDHKEDEKEVSRENNELYSLDFSSLSFYFLL